jgi:hypothetical protein
VKKGNRGGFTLAEIAIGIAITGFLSLVMMNQLGFMRNIEEGSLTRQSLEESVRNVGRDLKYAFNRGRNLKTVVLDSRGFPQADPADPNQLINGRGALIIEADMRPCLGANAFSPATTATNFTRVVVLCCGSIVQKVSPITIQDRNNHAITFAPACRKPGLVYARFKPDPADTKNEFVSKDCVPDFDQFVVRNEGFNSITNDALYSVFINGMTRTASGGIAFGGARIRNVEKFFSLGNTGSGMQTLCREDLQ